MSASPRVGATWLMGPADERERHLMRCRRRGERAWVVVARLGTPAALRPEQILARLRLTDSLSIRRLRDGYEIAGTLDAVNFDREAFERRLRGLAPRGADFGWARFPDDGATLDVLLEKAGSVERR